MEREAGLIFVNSRIMMLGIPVKLYFEGIGHIVTVETKRGELLRGTLANCEDNMNLLIENVTRTAKDGKQTHLQQVYIRGAQIKLTVFPDMLKHSPVFKLAQKKGKNQALGIGGRKRALAMRARAGTALMATQRPA